MDGRPPVPDNVRVISPSPALMQTTQDANVLLPSLVGISDMESKTQAINRRVELEGSMPFANSRLRAYTGRIDALTGGMATDVSSMQAPEGPLSVPPLVGPRPGSLDPLTPSRTMLSNGGMAEHATVGTPGQEGRGADRDMYTALSELDGIRADILRVEATLSALKEPEERSTMGRIIRKKPPRNPKVNDATLFNSQKAKWEAKLMATMEPVSRGEAVILDQALEEMIPEGQLAETLQRHKVFEASVFESEFELVDMVQKEAARQVRSTCLERGVLLEKVRTRYGEFFGVLAAFTHRLQQAHVEEQAASVDLRQRLDAKTKEAERLGTEAMQFKSDNDFLRQRLEALEGEFGEYKAAAEEALVQLHTDNSMLEHEVRHYQDRLSAAEAERGAAVSAAMSSLEEELSTITEERDDLVQRIRFLERQIAKLREERARPVAVDHASVQTEPEETAEEEEEDAEEEEEEGGGAQTGEGGAHGEGGGKKTKRAKESSLKKKGPGKRRSKKALHLGGFSKLLASDKVGRIKPKGLILKTICQIYSEKIVADEADDLAGTAREPLPTFTYDWHLNRYGLRTLAEINLLDLIASVRHYQAESIKVRLFAQFCGLQNRGDPDRGEIESLNFYLDALQVMVPENGAVSSLFPDTDDGVYWMSPMSLLPVLREVFRNLEDPQALRDFMAARVEPLMDPRRKMYDCDALQVVLQDEFERRTERNAAQLTALFRSGPTGTGDGQGVLTYDAFVAIVRRAAPDMTDQHLVRMYREALQMTGDGESIAPETFVSIASKYGIAGEELAGSRPRANLAEVTAHHGHDPHSYQGVIIPAGGGGAGGGGGGAEGAGGSAQPTPRGRRSSAGAGGGEPAEEVTVVPDETFDDEGLDAEAVTQFSMLDSALSGEEPVEDQLEALGAKVGTDSEAFLKAKKELARFQVIYSERQDWRAAWAQYRMLVGDLRTALVTYHGGLQKIEPPKADNAGGEDEGPEREGGGGGAGGGSLAEVLGGGEGGDGGGAGGGGVSESNRGSAGAPPPDDGTADVTALNMLKGTTGSISDTVTRPSDEG